MRVSIRISAQVAHTEIIRAFSAREAQELVAHRWSIGTCSSGYPCLRSTLTSCQASFARSSRKPRSPATRYMLRSLTIARRIALRSTTMGANRYRAVSPAVSHGLNPATTSGCRCSTSQHPFLPVVRATPRIRTRKRAEVPLALTGGQIVILVRQLVKSLRHKFLIVIWALRRSASIANGGVGTEVPITIYPGPEALLLRTSRKATGPRS